MSYLIFLESKVIHHNSYEICSRNIDLCRLIEKRISEKKVVQKVNAVFLQNDDLPSTLIKPSISTYIRS
jgi:hypothetical protein